MSVRPDRSPEPLVLRDDVLREEVWRYALPCGMPVLVHRKRGFRKTFAALGVSFGSVDTRFVDRDSGAGVEVPEGVAHFLEHNLFERDGRDAFEVFSQNGASANAVTSFRSTHYFFQCSGRHGTNLRTLLRLAFEPKFSDSAIEKEKGIIAQEIRMYEDSPDWRGYIDLVRGLFRRHPVRTDVTGSVESIAGIDRDVLLRCHRNFYDPANACLVLSGDVDPWEVARIAGEETSRFDGGRAVERLAVREPKGVWVSRTEGSYPVERPRLLIGFKDPRVPVRGEELRRRDLVTGLLLDLMFGSSSRTWQRLYEADVIDDSFFTSYAGEEDFGFVSLGGETDDPEGTRRMLFREIRRFGRDGFSTRDFGRLVHKSLGRFVRGLDSQEAVVFLWSHSVLRGVDPFRLPTLLRVIGEEEVMERHAELFGERNHATSVVRPSSPG